MTDNELRNTALRLLARREHSKQELTLKLLARFKDKDKVTAVVNDLSTSHWCDENRFIEQMIKAKLARGYGPLFIEHFLRSKGIDKTVAAEALRSPEFDWFATAKAVFDKRFGHPAADRKERAKQIRFLQNRGFTHEQIRHAMDYHLNT